MSSSPERLRFAGHERDANTSLDYMHARYYAPFGGRFLSVDPGRDYDFKSPQSFNLYAYVRNNPVGAVDPDGRGMVESCVQAGTCGAWASFLATTQRTLQGQATPQERAVVIAGFGAPLLAAGFATVAAAGLQAAASATVGLVVGALSTAPTLSDPRVPADQKAITALASSTVGMISGARVPATSPGASAASATIGSAILQAVSGQGISPTTTGVSSLGGLTGGMVARQYSYELVKSAPVLTAVNAVIQAIFDVLKAQTDKREVKRVVKVTSEQIPSTGEGQK